MGCPTQIELVDGPLAGRCHELQFGWPAPDRFGLPDGDKLHWYEIRDDGKAYYLRTETK